MNVVAYIYRKWFLQKFNLKPNRLLRYIHRALKAAKLRKMKVKMIFRPLFLFKILNLITVFCPQNEVSGNKIVTPGDHCDRKDALIISSKEHLQLMAVSSNVLYCT